MVGLATTIAVWAAPIAAHAGISSTLVGVSRCDSVTGRQVLTWTFTNNLPDTAAISAATVDATGLTAGSTIEATAAMSPLTGIAPLASSVGETHATGDAVGPYILRVTFSSPSFPGATLTTTVTLAGGCVAAATVPPSTLPPSTLPPSTTAVGGSGATLPHVGANPSGIPLGATVLIAVGVVLVLLRRRVGSTVRR